MSNAPSVLIAPNYRELVSHADLTYTEPATRSEEGQPLGNGCMGSLVWTTPSALKFQINRTDVFAENGATCSFPERHTDYLGGCGYVDVNFVDFGDDVFTGSEFKQHLSVYDGLMTLKGKGVSARLLTWPARDVMALEIEESRKSAVVDIDLRMLRSAIQYAPGANYPLATNHTVAIKSRNHTAASTLAIRNGCILLRQDFREGDYYDSSTVAIGVLGRKSIARYQNESTVQLSLAPGKGRYLILIASAASFNPEDDTSTAALRELEAAKVEGFQKLMEQTAAWWHDYWSKAFVQLHSTDGEAEFVDQNYNYFLYLMGSCSRGSFPPRFGGLLWVTTGDMQEWGSQFWWANMGCYYDGLLPANRPELLEPVFGMYSRMYEASARAARQQWGSQGIFIPETVAFDGLPTLPEDIAAEMRELYLGRKPWEHRSADFMRYAETMNPHNSRWNWLDKSTWQQGHWDIRDRGHGPRGPVVTILSSGAKIAHLYWQAYQYSQDAAFLRQRAYPMLKGVAEFYRNYPNVKKGTDAKYHIYDVNNHEPIWGATDPQEEIAAMHGIFPVAISAAEILNTDAALRGAWKEFEENLAPLPKNDAGQWINAKPPVLFGQPGRPGLVPAIYYDLCGCSTEDPEVLKTAQMTVTSTFGTQTPVSVLNQIATVAAHLGRAEDLRFILPNQIRCLAPQHDFCDWRGSGEAGVLRNRLTLREGPGAIDAERLGRITRGLHEALLQSIPPAPGKDPVIWVFPAWPKQWDAQFTLLARGAVLVTSSIRKGEIEFVELMPQADESCMVRNPWAPAGVAVYCNGKKTETLTTPFLKLATRTGDRIILAKPGKPPMNLVLKLKGHS